MKNIFWIFALTLCALIIPSVSFAQAERISYNNETKSLISININNGIDKFTGLNSKLTLICEPNKFSNNTQQNIKQSILGISGVKSCDFQTEIFSIIIIAKAAEKCPNYAEYKRILVEQGLEIKDSHEFIFK